MRYTHLQAPCVWEQLPPVLCNHSCFDVQLHCRSVHVDLQIIVLLVQQERRCAEGARPWPTRHQHCLQADGCACTVPKSVVLHVCVHRGGAVLQWHMA